MTRIPGSQPGGTASTQVHADRHDPGDRCQGALGHREDRQGPADVLPDSGRRRTWKATRSATPSKSPIPRRWRSASSRPRSSRGSNGARLCRPSRARQDGTTHAHHVHIVHPASPRSSRWRWPFRRARWSGHRANPGCRRPSPRRRRLCRQAPTPTPAGRGPSRCAHGTAIWYQPQIESWVEPEADGRRGRRWPTPRPAPRSRRSAPSRSKGRRKVAVDDRVVAFDMRISEYNFKSLSPDQVKTLVADVQALPAAQRVLDLDRAARVRGRQPAGGEERRGHQGRSAEGVLRRRHPPP